MQNEVYHKSVLLDASVSALITDPSGFYVDATFGGGGHSREILKNLKFKEVKLIEKIEDVDFKNSLLSDNLDLDYIETLIRERFIFGKKNEQILIIKKNEN